MRTDPGFSAYIQGAVKTLGAFDVEGGLRVTGNMSTGSNLFVLGTISSLGAFGARGDIMTMGSFLAPNGSIIANNLDVRGTSHILKLSHIRNNSFFSDLYNGLQLHHEHPTSSEQHQYAGKIHCL